MNVQSMPTHDMTYANEQLQEEKYQTTMEIYNEKYNHKNYLNNTKQSVRGWSMTTSKRDYEENNQRQEHQQSQYHTYPALDR
eukprot:936650-Amphidinium_carterae.1